MLVYDMLENSFRNQSGPDDIRRAEGVMLYLPVGDSGLLIYFGGVQLPYGNSTMEGVGVLLSVCHEIVLTGLGSDECAF